MKQSKFAINTVLAFVFAVLSQSALAVLPAGTTLTIDPGFRVCVFPAEITDPDDPDCRARAARGSFFIMDPGNAQETDTLYAGSGDGIILGGAQDVGTGSHPLLPVPEDTGSITDPWPEGFFGNTGHEFSVEPGIVTSDATSDPGSIGVAVNSLSGRVIGAAIPAPDDVTEFLEMNAWRVSWNGIPEINMGGGDQDCGTDTDDLCVLNGVNFAGIIPNGSQLAHLTCFSDSERTVPATPCAVGQFYHLEYAAKVPLADESGFQGVTYQVNIDGNIVGAGSIAANDDTVVTTINETISIPVLTNDTPPASLDPATVTIDSGPGAGASAIALTDGTISYTAPGSAGADSIGYSVSNTEATSTVSATVSIEVQDNEPPVANTFTAGVSAGATTNINVLDNVTDTNGNVDPGSVVIASPPGGGGSASVNDDNTIQYVAPASGGTDSFTYRVMDTGVPALASNDGTVNVSITDFVCDAASLPDENLNVLYFDTGVPADINTTPPLAGSFFTMELRIGEFTHTVLAPGPAGGITLGVDMFASGSHIDPPNAAQGADIFNEQPNLDQPWNFFSNTGMHLTRNGGIDATSDGCIDFSNKWVVTWNGIPAINMGGCVPSEDPLINTCPGNLVDLGIASIACDPAPCADGSSFSLEYDAHVPLEDRLPKEEKSGFPGVPYGLRLVGTLGSFPSALTSSAGTLGPGSISGSVRITSDDVDEETEESGVTDQCIGGCFDYEITGVTGSTVQVIIPLDRRIPADAQMRVFRNGAWQLFDTTNGVDKVESAAFTPGDGSCPGFSSTAFTDGLTEGNQCLRITKSDNGPNDTNPALGTIADPSGIAVSNIPPPPPPPRAIRESGCSVSEVPTSPWQRGDLWLIAGFLLLCAGLRRARG